jgi:hypothetical protein
MKILKTEILFQHGTFFNSQEFDDLLAEIETAIHQVVWPLGSQGFSINPTKKGNGVKPIKNGCMIHLQESGWELESRLKISSDMNPGPLDATKILSNGSVFALEWETGNISSSHRALNKMALGIMEGALCGGVLLLPSRKMYQFLTDRIGNFQEIAPYFPTWKNLNIESGYLAVIEIEHDNEDTNSPLIAKGTDGWAEFQNS